MNEMRALIDQIDAFAKERDWDQFHTPKNLVMALSVEAAELVEEFQWLTAEQSANLSDVKKERVKDEIGDILNYTLRLCSRLGIDPSLAVTDKIKKNAVKYPVEKSKGCMKKYNEI
ncbi:MAG: nucleotide pyrophosphohydrolase [Fibrobacter sp.]|nr:nucleotide pyrophosphohydrolase [Fibrobacter sp.]